MWDDLALTLPSQTEAVMERDPGANEILMKIQNEKNKRYH